ADGARHRAEDVLHESEARLELFFSQSLDGFFFMMLDEPVRWDDTVDKDKVLDYVFSHQRMTKVNDAMLAQYGATREQFLGLTPNDFYEHNLAHGREVWRRFFDAGRLHVETDERKLDGTPLSIEGDYICFCDSAGRITGHFGIQRDVTERKRAEEALRQYNQRLKILQEIDRAILAARSPAQIAQAAMRHIHELVPCLRASVAVFDFMASKAVLIAIHAKIQTKLDVETELTLEAFGDIGQLWLGKVNVVEDTETFSPQSEAVTSVRAEGVRAYINVPLRAQGELIGVLNLGSERQGRFSDKHIEIAQEVANNLAIAIRQARLYEQIAQHAIELEQRVAERTVELSEANANLKNEIAERKRAEQALHDRLAIEQMISEISTRFINLSWQQVDEGIDYVLERIGKLADVDRSYLFLFSDDGKKARNTHEWCAPEVTPQMQNLQDLAVADFPWIFPKVLRGETVYVPRVAELPVEAQAEKTIMQEQDIQSLLVVPLTFGGGVAGLLGFDSVKSEKVWQAEDVRLLIVVGEIIANFFQRARAEQAIRESEERLRAIGNAIPDILFVVDEDGRYQEILTSEENLLYFSADKLKGKLFDEVFPPPLADRFLASVQRT
ncbi:MAG: GAF domain-containing protein, partial [bacterium]